VCGECGFAVFGCGGDDGGLEWCWGVVEGCGFFSFMGRWKGAV
jgi:hypothetical protein